MGQIITFPLDYVLDNAVEHRVDLPKASLGPIGQ